MAGATCMESSHDWFGGSVRYQVVLFSMLTLLVMGSYLKCCMSPHARKCWEYESIMCAREDGSGLDKQMCISVFGSSF